MRDANTLELFFHWLFKVPKVTHYVIFHFTVLEGYIHSVHPSNSKAIWPLVFRPCICCPSFDSLTFRHVNSQNRKYS